MYALDVFEELLKLKDDPVAFNKRKDGIINSAINECPEDNRISLTCRQWKLERELDKFKNPTARMNRMVELFWDGAFEFKNALDGDLPKKVKHDSTIIPLKKKT